MNKKLELDFSEILLAAAGNNPDRMLKILHRLDYDGKEKLAKALLKSLSGVLIGLPPGTVKAIQEEFGFEIKIKEVANANIGTS